MTKPQLSDFLSHRPGNKRSRGRGRRKVREDDGKERKERRE
jgi:hypothetical protein